MATLGTLDYLISIKDNGMDSKLNQAENKVKGWGNKLSAWTVAKGQMIGTFATKAVEKAAGMVRDVIKGAFDAYADYEQLVGGIDTLFKGSSQKVQDYASKAFLNVGVSANQYMETVTSFSASLLQSLSGDTDKAADISNMAMIDMADNVNKMGSSMESVENAYKGFAKQNYTMLDNLKLGYGGTKKEMERLLKDATKLTGQKYDIKKLSDVYEAIHAIQKEMGIAGTTQKEAMTTVTGSMNAAKASWQDVLTAMGSGKGVKKAIKNFAGTLKTAIKNAAPVVRQAVSGMVEGIKEIAPELGNLVNEVGRGLFGKDWDITINWIQNAWEDVKGAFTTAAEWVGNAYKVTVEWLQKAWATVSNAFDDAVKWVGNVYNVTVKWINDAWDAISGAFKDAGEWIGKTFQTTVQWVQQAWDDVKNAIAEVGKGIWENTVNFTLGLFQGVKDFINSIPKAINVVVNFVRKAVDSVTNDTGTFQGGEPSGLGWGETMDVGTVPGWDGFAKGSWNISRNNQKALLHKGEIVLNQSQARRYREGEGYSDGGAAYAASRAVKDALKEVKVMMSGEKVGDLTTKRVKHNINASSYAVQKAYGG